MSIVGPFAARVVSQEWAGRAVTSLSDPLVGADTEAAPLQVDPAAYAACPPAVYVYRQTGAAGSHVGLVCEVAVEAFADGRVRGHEAVQPSRVEALVRHRATTTGPPALVTLLHRAGPAFTRTIDRAGSTSPLLDFDGSDGLRHTVWRVDDGPAVAAVVEELAAAEHYIADGHHRVAAALEEWRRDGEPADGGMLCVVHAMDDLRLSAFHRRVTGPVRLAELVALLRDGFEVRAVTAVPSPGPATFGLYVGRTWFEVRHPGGRVDGPAELDAAVLQAGVLDRLHRLSPGPAYTVEIAPTPTSMDELTERCDADEGALFTLAPPALEVLTALADAGQVMPPKTTYFEPKPGAGIFLRPQR